jgi:hypothetical protein
MEVAMPIVNEFWEVWSMAHGPKGEMINNSFTYVADNEGALAISAQSVAESWEDVVWGALHNCLTSAWTYVRTEATCILGHNIGSWGESYANAGEPGTNGTLGNLCNAVILKKLSPFAGRKNRGRLFLSPVPASYFNTDGQFIGDPSLFNLLGEAMVLPITAIAIPEGTLTLSPLVSINATDPAHQMMTNYATSLSMGMRRSRRLRSLN